MIPESRETIPDDKREECIQYLETTLRQDDFHAEVKKFNDSIERKLTYNAIDWLYRHNYNPKQETANELAGEAIQRYYQNWKNKKPGDNEARSHRLGKTW